MVADALRWKRTVPEEAESGWMVIVLLAMLTVEESRLCVPALSMKVDPLEDSLEDVRAWYNE